MSHPHIKLPRLIAHRGLSAHAPENTLSAVRAAHTAGCQWVELDVQLLGDNTAVIWHDRDVNRCSNGRGRLRDMNLADAKALDVGSWFSPDFTGERMATLADMLALLKTLKMGVNLELKVNRGHDPAALAEAAIPVLMKALPSEKYVVSSFSAKALAHARALASTDQLALGCLFDRVPSDWQARCQSIQAWSLHANWKKLTQQRARAVSSAGYPLICFTANDPARFIPFWKWGTTAVISDDPTLFSNTSANLPDSHHAESILAAPDEDTSPQIKRR
ncbi:glycerophosphoryl diester phosphodiesterase [Halomonas halocynthiae]|uniref:glycerophosphoryl diester phosphodiesterase n=1 Tax=Halomonas halocynthiae TaxID=176290 RepID=UPI000A06DF68|nr:glycerophosphoryl diester phosphodiesterase [Halomonas halocynthiae]